MQKILRNHRARVAAKQRELVSDEAPAEVDQDASDAAAAPKPSSRKVLDATLETLGTALKRDLKAMKEISGDDDKQAFKEVVYSKYLPLVKEYLATGSIKDCPALFYTAMWAVDTGDMVEAWTLIEACVTNGQKLPRNFKSKSVEAFLSENIHDWAEDQIAKGESANPYMSDVIANMNSGAWKIEGHVVRGKLCRMAGLNSEAQSDHVAALAFYEQAQTENKEAGCMGRITKIQKQIKSDNKD